MAKKTLASDKAGERKLPATKTTTATVERIAPVQTPAAKVESPKAAPTREEIAKRAFEIFMGRGQAAGREKEDWAQAERELQAEAHRNN
jgi:Protein of unknown function (DUF2934)